eukprot:7313-Heterocapsa_arctica.AAC.1
MRYLVSGPQKGEENILTKRKYERESRFVQEPEQRHFDKKWKYRQKTLGEPIDIDEEHRSTRAEIIDAGKGSPNRDTIALAKDKGLRGHLNMSYKSGDEKVHCEPDRTGERPGDNIWNYKHWKFKQKKLHSAPVVNNRFNVSVIIYIGGKRGCIAISN